MTRYLVTGGGGFIGRHLVARLRGDASHEVVTVGRSVDLTRRENALAAFRDAGPVDYIIHLADVQGDATWSAQHAAEQFLANHYIGLHVLDGWMQHQAQAQFVGVSSLWAFPESVVDVDEREYWNGRMHAPTEHYGFAKKLVGVGIGAARRQHGLRGTMLVLGSVYGPDDPTFHVIPSLIRRMRSQPDRLDVFGDGSQTRDFIYIDDQIEGIIRHLDHDGELLNIGSGRTYTIREVVEALVRVTAYAGEVHFDASKGAGVANRRMLVHAARAASGWPDNHQFVSLDEGLRRTVAALEVVA